MISKKKLNKTFIRAKAPCTSSISICPRIIDLYNTLLKKRISSFRATMQAAQTLNVVRLEASQT